MATLTGAQSGAVRYALQAELGSAHVCHRRMGQKATGPRSPHWSALKDKGLGTKGEPSFFHSSNLATRGFCSACGTPPTFACNDPKARFYVTMGSLDSPEASPVTRHYGVESRIG